MFPIRIRASKVMTASNGPSPSSVPNSEPVAAEPSMDDILASIRRIIADDDALPLSRSARAAAATQGQPPQAPPSPGAPSPRPRPPMLFWVWASGFFAAATRLRRRTVPRCPRSGRRRRAPLPPIHTKRRRRRRSNCGISRPPNRPRTARRPTSGTGARLRPPSAVEPRNPSRARARRANNSGSHQTRRALAACAVAAKAEPAPAAPGSGAERIEP